MSELERKYGSVVIPEEQRLECEALPDDELKAAAHGSPDLSLTFAARQEIGRRIIPGIVERSFDRSTE